VEARLVERVRGRPPRSDLILDLTVENPAAEDRWCILPAVLPAAEQGGVFAVEVSLLAGSGRVLLGKLLGTASAQALLVPAGARIRLSRLVVATWGEVPLPLQLDVTLATHAVVGSDDLALWFPENPRCDSTADVAGPVDLISSRATEDRSEQPLVLTGVATTRLDIADVRVS
jgi:hypothetical protein